MNVRIPLFGAYSPHPSALTIMFVDKVPELLLFDLEEIADRYLRQTNTYIAQRQLEAEVSSFLRQHVIEGDLWYDQIHRFWRYAFGWTSVRQRTLGV